MEQSNAKRLMLVKNATLIDQNPRGDLGTALPVAVVKPRLLDQVRQAIRTRHYSYMTEKAYVGWIKRFIFYHSKRHPAEMGEPEIPDSFPASPRTATLAPPLRTKPSTPCCFSTVRS